MKNSNSPTAGNFNNYDDDETPYSESLFSCKYLNETSFCAQFRNNSKFFVMSLNIQSLKAKFNDFRQLISNLLYSNCAPDIICIQEIWQIPSNDLFHLPNYFPLEYLTRRNNVQGGGVWHISERFCAKGSLCHV
jgi:hypothetical protein